MLMLVHNLPHRQKLATNCHFLSFFFFFFIFIYFVTDTGDQSRQVKEKKKKGKNRKEERKKEQEIHSTRRRIKTIEARRKTSGGNMLVPSVWYGS